MKKTSDFRFWSRFGTGIFCLMVFAFFVIKAAIIKPEVNVMRFDTNESGVPDVLRVYFDGSLHRELIDFDFTNVYTYRIFWKENGAVKRIERMLDVKKWLYEYYHEPVDHDNYFTQELDMAKTFKRFSVEQLDFIGYRRVKLYVKDEHIFAAEYFIDLQIKPYVVAIYDKYGRFSEVYRDLNSDNIAEEKIVYQGGRLVGTIACQQPLPFDTYDYLYKKGSSGGK